MKEVTFEDLFGKTAKEMIDDDAERWERQGKYGLEFGVGPFFVLGINSVDQEGEKNETCRSS